jgi:prephenate dehydrogenase
MTVEFERVTIIGVGLIGGSLGLVLRRRGLARRVVGVGHRQASLDRAVEVGAVDAGTLSVAEGVAGAELVVLATPVGRIEAQAAAGAPHLARGAIVTDVASTKGRLVAALDPMIARAGGRFVGAHPLAGSHERSVDAAREDLFEGATVVVTPTGATDGAALALVEALWCAAGARIIRVSPADHDAVLAFTSHLPHLAAAALALAVGGCGVGKSAGGAGAFTAGGFKDATRIAASDPALWRDIFLDNRESVLAALDALEAHLADFRAALRRGDGAALEAALTDAKTVRDRLVPRKA